MPGDGLCGVILTPGEGWSIESLSGLDETVLFRRERTPDGGYRLLLRPTRATTEAVIVARRNGVSRTLRIAIGGPR